MSLKAKVAAIEFSGDEVRLAVARTGRRLPKVLELHSCRAQYETPEERPDALRVAVSTVVKRMKNRPSTYVLCVSSALCVVRTLTIPFRGARKVAQVAPSELEPYLAFPIEELAIDFRMVLEVDKQTDVLAVGIRREVLQEQLGLLETAGIDVEGVDVDAAAITGLWRSVKTGLKGLHAALHVREEGSILAITHNNTLAYFRHLSFDAARLRDHPLAAARDVQNSLRAFQTGWRGDSDVASLTLTGTSLSDGNAPEASCAGRTLEEVRECFENEFEFPVLYENLLVSVKATQAAARDESCARRTIDAQTALVIASEAKQSPSPESTEAYSEPAGVDEAADTPFGESFTAQERAEDPSLAVVSEASEAENFIFEAMPEADADEPVLPAEVAAPEEQTPAEAAPFEFLERSNCWEATIGAAGNAVGNGYSLNFRKGDLASKNTLRGVIPHVLVTSALALLLLSGIAWFFQDARGRNESAGEQFQVQIGDLEKEIGELQSQGINVPATMFSDPTLLDVLNEIAGKMPESKVHITELKVDRGDGQNPWITVRGQVKDDAAFTGVAAELRKSALFQIDEPELRLEGGISTFKILGRRIKN